jgi:hypothetical protein
VGESVTSRPALRGFPIGRAGLGGAFRFAVGVLRKLVSLDGVFHGLTGILMSRLVIFFAVMRRGNSVRVRGQIMVLRRSLVRVFGHARFS